MLAATTELSMKVHRVVANTAVPDPALAGVFYGDILGLDVLMDMDWIRTYGNEARMSVQLSFMRPQASTPGSESGACSVACSTGSRAAFA